MHSPPERLIPHRTTRLSCHPVNPLYDGISRRSLNRVNSMSQGKPSQGEQPVISVGEQPARAEALIKQYDSNIANGNAPYRWVRIRTREEVEWIMARRGWVADPHVAADKRPDFREAHFHNAQLAGVNLAGADLRGAFIRGANFRGADLRAADVSEDRDARVLLFLRSLLSLVRLAYFFTGLIAVAITLAVVSEAENRGRLVDPLQKSLAHAAPQDVAIGVTILLAVWWYVCGIIDAFAVQWYPNLPPLFVKTDMTDAKLGDANLSYTNLDHADFTRANLEGADFFHASLQYATFDDVMWGNTNLGSANLTGARIESPDRLKDMRLDAHTRLDGVRWLTLLRNMMRKSHTFPVRLRTWQEMSTSFRATSIGLRDTGYFTQASVFRQLERQVERRILLAEYHLVGWLGSWLLDTIAGYGERPGRIFRTYLVAVVAFATAYWSVTRLFPGTDPKTSPLHWYEALVLSLSSFHGRGLFPTTLTLGDPVAIVAAVEAAVGLFIELILIATFSRRFLGNS